MPLLRRIGCVRRVCLSVSGVSWSSIDTDERMELISDRYVLRFLKNFSRFPFLTSYFNQFLNVLGYLWPWLGPPLAALRHVMYFRLYG